MFVFAKTKYFESKFEYFPYKTVCDKQGLDSTISSYRSFAQLDCMGELADSLSFCKSQFPDSKLLARAYYDKKGKVLTCQFAKRAHVELPCDKGKIYKCKDSKLDCGKIKPVFANSLHLYHSSIINEHLKCYFSSELN